MKLWRIHFVGGKADAEDSEDVIVRADLEKTVHAWCTEQIEKVLCKDGVEGYTVQGFVPLDLDETAWRSWIDDGGEG